MGDHHHQPHPQSRTDLNVAGTAIPYAQPDYGGYGDDGFYEEAEEDSGASYSQGQRKRRRRRKNRIRKRKRNRQRDRER